MDKPWKDLRLKWDEYFMALALMTAGRSSCIYIHTGTVIVKDKRVISTGYNGVAPGFDKSCLETACQKDIKKMHGKNNLSCIGSHAETNALLQPTLEDKSNAIIYTLYSPCYSCAKQIAAARISEVVYQKKYPEEFDAVDDYFKKAGISFRNVKLSDERIKNLLFDLF